MRLLLPLLLLAAGCDAAPERPPAYGYFSAEVRGTRELVLVGNAAFSLAGGRAAVTMVEGPGRSLTLGLPAADGLPVPGPYAVGPLQDTTGAATAVLALDGVFAAGEDGTVTLTEVSAERLAGTFAVWVQGRGPFGEPGGTLLDVAGTFAAVYLPRPAP